MNQNIKDSFAAIIVAAGSGTRMGFDKMLKKLSGKSVIKCTTEAFLKCPLINEIIVVVSENNEDAIISEFENANLTDKVKIVRGGKTRGESSVNGIRAAKSKYVLIHDGARPLITEEIISGTIKAVVDFGAAAPGVVPKDTLKTVNDGFSTATIDRSATVLVQTPQGFEREKILTAYEKVADECTDDCGIYEKWGGRVKITEGSYENIKLTTPEDIITAQEILRKRNNSEKEILPMRIGTGFDTHRLSENRELILGGIKIPHDKGLLGHSDADVVIHAIIDALFGAAALGDIGTHFPDTSPEYKGIKSTILLKEAGRLILENGYKIGNIDVTVIAQAPKLSPYIDKMRECISEELGITKDRVSIKAKTNENMGFTGRKEGIEARAVALLNTIS